VSGGPSFQQQRHHRSRELPSPPVLQKSSQPWPRSRSVPPGQVDEVVPIPIARPLRPSYSSTLSRSNSLISSTSTSGTSGYRRLPQPPTSAPIPGTGCSAVFPPNEKQMMKMMMMRGNSQRSLPPTPVASSSRSRAQSSAKEDKELADWDWIRSLTVQRHHSHHSHRQQQVLQRQEGLQPHHVTDVSSMGFDMPPPAYNSINFGSVVVPHEKIA